MIQKLCIAALWLCLLSAPDAGAFDERRPPLATQGSIQSAFAPWDDVEGLIVEVLGDAKKQIRVQAYLLTSSNIAQALIDAHRRGIDVQILADADQFRRGELSKLPELADAGIAVWLETKYQNAHNKILLIDAQTADATLITGSYNFTWSAQHKNAENILVVRKNLPLATQYLTNWERHRQDASPFKK